MLPAGPIGPIAATAKWEHILFPMPGIPRESRPEYCARMRVGKETMTRTNTRSLSHRLLYLAVAAVGVVAGIASAQSATVIGPYNKTLSRTCGAGINNCGVIFPLVPANRRIEVEHITCQVETSGTLEDMYAYSGDMNGGLTPASVIHYLAPTWTRQVFGKTLHNFSDDTGIFAAAGQRLVVLAQTDQPTIRIKCSLFGKVIAI